LFILQANERLWKVDYSLALKVSERSVYVAVSTSTSSTFFFVSNFAEVDNNYVRETIKSVSVVNEPLESKMITCTIFILNVDKQK